jgi:hypothetical protein
VLDIGGKLGMNLCAFNGNVHGLKQRFFADYADETVFAGRNKSIFFNKKTHFIAYKLVQHRNPPRLTNEAEVRRFYY